MNTKEAGKRIKLILDYFDISPSVFADKIGVQRSSISHILSGRNNPSLDIIHKIITKFPDINPMWLIAGKGEMKQLSLFDEVEKKARKNGTDDTYEEEDTDAISYKDTGSAKTTPTPSGETNKDRPALKVNDSHDDIVDDVFSSSVKKISRIVVFYEDKTFSVFTPES